MSLDDFAKNSKIRKIKIDFPSKCNANCIGCYTKAKTKNSKKRLEIIEIKKILYEAKKLNFKQLVIAADGEPLIDKNYFFSVVELADKLGFESIIYTNGSLINPKIAKKLFELNTSLIVKRNSMNHEKQNKILGTKLSKKMFKGINNLIETGFSGDRLWIESYISKINEKDLDDVLRFVRKNGLNPYFEVFIREGQPKKVLKKMELTKNELFNTFTRFKKIDEEEFGIKQKIPIKSRVYPISKCALKKLVSIDTSGNVKKCIMQDIYGNIRKENFQKIYKKITPVCKGCSLVINT